MSKDLLGIPNLQVKLSKLLENRVRDSLPAVKSDLRDQLYEAQNELKGMGSSFRSTYSRRKYFSDVMDKQCNLLEAAIGGKYDRYYEFFSKTADTKLRSILNVADNEFQCQILNVKIPIVVSEMAIGDEVSFLYENTWYDEGVLDSIAPKGNSIRCDSYGIRPIHNISDCNIRPSLIDVKAKIAAERGDELHLFPSYSIFVSLVQEKVDQWNAPMHELQDYYVEKCKTLLEAVIQEVTSIPKVRRFLQADIIDNHFDKIQQRCSIELEKTLQQELRPYTLNNALYDSFNQMKTASITKAIDSLSGTNGLINKAAVQAILKNSGIHETVSNADQEALQLIMGAAAYLKIASKRFIDKAPMLLHDHLLKPVLSVIKSINHLDDSQLEGILVVSEADQNHRKNLEDKIASLTAANDLMARELYSNVGR